MLPLVLSSRSILICYFASNSTTHVILKSAHSNTHKHEPGIHLLNLASITHLILSREGVNVGDKLVIDVESVSLFECVSSDGRSTVTLRWLPDNGHVVLPYVLYVQVCGLRRLLCITVMLIPCHFISGHGARILLEIVAVLA